MYQMQRIHVGRLLDFRSTPSILKGNLLKVPQAIFDCSFLNEFLKSVFNIRLVRLSGFFQPVE